MNDPASTLAGGCACGRLRFRLRRRPMFTHCCHCTQCQALGGAAFALNTIIENEAIALQSGTLTVTPGPSESGRVHDIFRCDNCFTAVWSDYGGRPNYRFVRVGALDKPHPIKPDAHIFTRSKVDWVKIPDDQPQFEVFYALEALWPPDQLERRRLALSGKPA